MCACALVCCYVCRAYIYVCLYVQVYCTEVLDILDIKSSEVGSECLYVSGRLVWIAVLQGGGGGGEGEGGGRMEGHRGKVREGR